MQSETSESGTVPETGATSRRPRRFRKRRFRKVPRMPQPVKALWESASEEERKRAHRTSVELIGYWLGRTTKAEVAERLSVTPLRVWQLSQQALAGMVAGLLKQPRPRKGTADPAPDEPTHLRRRLLALEKECRAKDTLISLLKEMPAHRETARQEARAGRRDAGRKTTKAPPRGAGAGRKVPAGGTGEARGAQ
jgi:hypothetical protein